MHHAHKLFDLTIAHASLIHLTNTVNYTNVRFDVMKNCNQLNIKEYFLCIGGWQDETWPDGWTAVTRDGKRSAQFEHTLLVTETGCEILTRRLEDNGRAHFLSQM